MSVVGEPRGHANPDPFAEYDAAYVFGALAPDERVAYEQHLSQCDACSASVAAMAGVPGLLSRVPIERVIAADSAPVPDTLLPKMVREVDLGRQRARWRTGAALALAAACVLGLLVAVLVQHRSGRTAAAGNGRTPSSVTSPSASWSDPGAGPELKMVPVANTGLTAAVQLQSVGWGTKITMKCHEPPLTAGTVRYTGMYFLVAVTANSSRRSVADWAALPGETVTIEGDTGQARSDITSLLLEDADHEVLLKLDL